MNFKVFPEFIEQCMFVTFHLVRSCVHFNKLHFEPLLSLKPRLGSLHSAQIKLDQVRSRLIEFQNVSQRYWKAESTACQFFFPPFFLLIYRLPMLFTDPLFPFS